VPPVYVTEQGARLGVRQRRLVVRKQEQEIAAVPLVKISEVVLLGNISLTTPAIKTLLRRGIDVVFLNRDGRYCGRLVGPPTKFGDLRRWQYRRLDDAAYKMRAAQAIVEAKLRNCRTLLMRYNRTLHDPAVGAAVDSLQRLIARSGRTETLNALLGVEGQGAAIYFGVFKRLFNDDWPFEKRVRRPPTDGLNVLLSFGYTLLGHAMESAIHLVGLDPYLGLMHVTEYGRPSLALDLIEEFRHIVVDSIVLRACNERLITVQNFSEQDDPQRPILLDDAGRKRFLREWEARLALEFTHPLRQERTTYRRAFELQAREMARAIKEGDTYRPFTVR
jgi:CRISPR-associated protein Cas1